MPTSTEPLIHKVVQGDSLASIAQKYRVADWQTIYDHTANEAFRKLHPDPNVLLPDTSVVIPPVESKEHEAQTGSWNKYVVTLPEHQVEVVFVLRNVRGTGMPEIRWEALVGKETHTGRTARDGIIRFPAQASEKTATLRIWFPGSDLPTKLELDISHLDPVDTPAGLRTRLENLGFPLRDEDPTETLRAFQHWAGIKVTGQADDATHKRILELHDRGEVHPSRVG